MSLESFTRIRTYSPAKNRIGRWQTTFPVSCSNRTTGPEAWAYSAYYVGTWKQTLDVVTPGYHRLRAEGKRLPINPLLIRENKVEAFGNSNIVFTSVADVCTSPSAKQIDTNGGSYFISWKFPLEILNPSQITGDEKMKLQTEIQTRCLADRQKGLANLVESLAEVDQTFSMIRHPLKAVDDFLVAFRGYGRRARGFSKVAAASFKPITFLGSEYLKFRYGISPLISDVKAGMKTLKRNYQPDPKIHRSTATGQLERSAVTNGSISGSRIKIDYQGTTRHVFDIRCFWEDIYKANPWTDLGITFHNVLGVWWELTHYSFVLDWFVNVGDLIYANVPRVGVQEVGGYFTYKDQILTVWAPTGTTNLLPSTWTLVGGASDSARVTDTELKRGRFTPSDAGLVIKHDFRFDHWTRAADAAALVIQRLHSISFLR